MENIYRAKIAQEASHKEPIKEKRSQFKELIKILAALTPLCTGFNPDKTIVRDLHPDGSDKQIKIEEISEREQPKLYKTRYYREIKELYNDPSALKIAGLRKDQLKVVDRYLPRLFVKMSDGRILPYLPTTILRDGEIRLTSIQDPSLKTLHSYGLSSSSFKEAMRNGVSDVKTYLGGLINVEYVDSLPGATQGFFFKDLDSGKKRNVAGRAFPQLDVRNSKLLGESVAITGRTMALDTELEFSKMIPKEYQPWITNDTIASQSENQIRTGVGHEMLHLVLGPGHIKDDQFSILYPKLPVRHKIKNPDTNPEILAYIQRRKPLEDAASVLARTMLMVMRKEYPHVGHGIDWVGRFGEKKYIYIGNQIPD